MGTLVAVLLYFLPTWIELTLCGVGLRYPRTASRETIYENKQTFWYLVIATVPAGLCGLLFEKMIEAHLRQPIPIACALIVVGLLMWWADTRASLQHEINQISFIDALLIGAAQALALFPGVSRSGITIAVGLQRGMKREAAARFSFLLATPVIAGAALKELPKLIRMHQMGTLEVSLSTLIVSIAVSGLLGMAVIAFFLRYLQTRTLKIFIYYRILFGIVILFLAFLQMGSAR
jgi:undecaprenyl-diphosphatase